MDVFGDSAEDSGVMWLEVLDDRRRDEESLLTIRPNKLLSFVLLSDSRGGVGGLAGSVGSRVETSACSTMAASSVAIAGSLQLHRGSFRV